MKVNDSTKLGNPVSRSDHLEWCKKRALECLDQGDIQGAFASMASDLGKHEETSDHVGIQLGIMLMMGGNLSTEQEMRKFIEDFN